MHTDIPPIALAFYRWALASMIVVIWAWPKIKEDWPSILQNWKILLVLSLLGVSAFNTLVYIGLQSTTAINGLLLNTLIPVIIAILGWLWLKDALNHQAWLGILLSLTGAIHIITRGEIWQGGFLQWHLGDLWIFLAVVGYALYTLVLRWRPKIHPRSLLATTFVMGALMLVPFYLWEQQSVEPCVEPWEFSYPVVLTIVYVAIFPSILSYLFYNRGVELIGAAKAGLFIHLMPVIGSLMAVVILGESFAFYHLVGILLVMSGLVLFLRNR